MERFTIIVHGLSDSYIKWFCGYPSNLQSSVCSFKIFANLWHFYIKLIMFFLGLGPLLLTLYWFSYHIVLLLFVYCFVLVYLLSVVFVSCLLSFVNLCLNVVLFMQLAIWLLTLYIKKQEMNWNYFLLYYVRYNIAT
jgi:hypothetical protein